MTNREYWIMTEVFVYLHKTDVCNDPDCVHCEFIAKVFALDELCISCREER